MTNPQFGLIALGSLALLSLRCGDELPASYGRNPQTNSSQAGAPAEGGTHSLAGASGCERDCGGALGEDSEEHPSGGGGSPSDVEETPSGEVDAGSGDSAGSSSGSEAGAGARPSNEEPDTNAEPSPLFEALQGVLDQHCVSCHRGAPHFVFTNDDEALHARLTEPLATNVCNERVLVVPSSPETSLLVEVVRGATDCTRRMPFGCELDGGTCLSEAEVGVITEWIAAGAPE